MKKLGLLLILSLVLPVFSGCHTTPASSTKEAKVDAAMSQGGGLPGTPPETGPGEPQKAFDQEANQSR